ncbi:hypothetical protein BC628DRAFT_1356602 [Trametes gibbosa]|nr:hypothetical protein BC628DRAFT_1356602 [Trametes gibbosa]
MRDVCMGRIVIWMVGGICVWTSGRSALVVHWYYYVYMRPREEGGNGEQKKRGEGRCRVAMDSVERSSVGFFFSLSSPIFAFVFFFCDDSSGSRAGAYGRRSVMSVLEVVDQRGCDVGIDDVSDVFPAASPGARAASCLPAPPCWRMASTTARYRRCSGRARSDDERHDIGRNMVTPHRRRALLQLVRYTHTHTYTYTRACTFRRWQSTASTQGGCCIYCIAPGSWRTQALAVRVWPDSLQRRRARRSS